MIQLNRLEGFFWVAETGGYSKAARAFPYPITQPAVYQQVKKLEAEIGVALFERVGKDRILLTPAGKKLHEFVGPFFGGLASLLRTLRAGEYEGELRIHASAMFLRYLLPGWLRKVQRRHPEIRIDLQEMIEVSCAPLLRGETDLIVSHLTDLDPQIDTIPVGTLYPFLVFPRAHRLAKRAAPRITDFREETFVAYSPNLPQHRLQIEELARRGVHPARVLTASTADTILGMVESGMGYSLLPYLTEEGPRLKGVATHLLPGKRHRYPVHAAWRRSSAGNPLLDAVLELAPRA